MDRNELAEWLERMSVVAEAEGFRSAEFHVDRLREIAAALRESEEWRRDAELWRAFVKKVDSDQYQQFCVKFGDVLKTEIAAIDAARKEGV
jgi:predicted phage-related endonuclease